MAFVLFAFSFARERERLTGAASCPNRSVVGPPGELQGVGPAADTGKEVALPVSGEAAGRDFRDAPLIDASLGDQPRLHQFPKPLGGPWVEVAVVVHYRPRPLNVPR